MLTLTRAEAPHLYDPCQALEDHYKLIDGFIHSHKVRNLQPSTIEKERRFLDAWFNDNGPGHRPLYTWEVMNYLSGRKHIIHYTKGLIATEVSTHTVRAYLGILHRYFSFILEHPVIFDSEEGGVRIQDRYGVTLVQPVSEFDMPRYVYEGERAGIPLDPERLYEFFSVVRDSYLGRGHEATRRRNYAILVLAGETGLRIDEIIHLELEKDLFFESHKVQTRHAKAAKGSGKRARITLFPPFARDTMTFYLRQVRPHFCNNASGLLFPTRHGEALSYSDLYRALKDMALLARKTGFPVQDHFCWHWLRRIFATRFVERFPGKIDVLIELLGHMSPNTVHRYIRHSRAWMDKQMQSVLEGVEQWPYAGD